ncbi:MAG TPA: hypothetical protein VGS97_15785 [Actinocrinis sp.]|uniref:hypothetical protein n=1 Tax=Actinocrinis sp. TaxID=1920516 RepID=UPI002DDD1FB1|nr:hypothetical protein [Actinocrinis sp.]HEV2345559.1 hypothetical protein [Actinocrinis sp.]
MTANVVRLMVGLPVGALFPLGVPGLRDSLRVHTGVGLAYSAFVLAPVFPQWRSWVLLVLTGAACVGLRSRLGPSRGAAPETPWISSMFAPRHVVIPGLVVGLTAAVGLLAGPRSFGGYLGGLLHDDRVVLISAGALTSIFIGGAIVEQVLEPHTGKLRLKSSPPPGEPSELRALVGAGMLIGWLERAIVFSFVMAGQSTAAVLALTAKSVARFPALSRNEEGFAEYFLVGTLTSLVMALGPALATHWLLGAVSPG